jgi:hypothetical protein
MSEHTFRYYSLYKMALLSLYAKPLKIKIID